MRSKKKRVASTSAPVPKKKARITSESSKNQPSTSRASTSSGATTSDEIDTNECCVCFRTYSEDVLESTGLDPSGLNVYVEDGSMKTAFHMIFLQIPMEMNYCAFFVVYDCYNTIYVLLTSAALNKKFLHAFE